VVALFIPLAGAWGVLRLGHPASLWGRRRYSGERLERAQARYAPDARGVRWQRRISDLIAGAPTPAPAPAPTVAATADDDAPPPKP
jgi:hypothetical protein